jgi:hypothetical protein
MVTAAMARAPHCRAEAVVTVEPAVGLELLPLAMLLSTSQGWPFASCADLPLAITHSSHTFIAKIRPSANSSHCASVSTTLWR